jgi:hypothetical protein
MPTVPSTATGVRPDPSSQDRDGDSRPLEDYAFRHSESPYRLKPVRAVSPALDKLGIPALQLAGYGVSLTSRG